MTPGNDERRPVGGDVQVETKASVTHPRLNVEGHEARS